MQTALMTYSGSIGSLQASTSPAANSVPISGSDSSLTPGPTYVQGPSTGKQLGITSGGQVTASTSSTIAATVGIVLASAAGGAITLTLPPVAVMSGLYLTIVKTDSTGNVVTLQGNGAELINAANTDTSLSAQFNVVRLYCDGTIWRKV